jgi:predicted ABC-type ATPase
MEKKNVNELIIVGGPNGSGKTTLAREFLANTNDYQYLSADDIAFEINPDNPASVRLQAGKEFFRRFQQAINSKQNLLIESTLSGKSLQRIIRQVREQHYTITLIFIFLDNEDICIRRVQARVKQGGHHVPEEDIIRRFGRSIDNFWNLYSQISDRWMLYYNTEDSFQEVAHQMENNLYIYDESLFSKFKALIDDYE